MINLLSQFHNPKDNNSVKLFITFLHSEHGIQINEYQQGNAGIEPNTKTPVNLKRPSKNGVQLKKTVKHKTFIPETPLKIKYYYFLMNY